MALRTYVQGVFSDRERKSMQAMLARVTEPVACQAFQHFITHAPWDASRVWRLKGAKTLLRRHQLVLVNDTAETITAQNASIMAWRHRGNRPRGPPGRQRQSAL